MTQEKLFHANRLAKELKRWQHIELLLSLGSNFCCLKFEAYETGSSDKYENLIEDRPTFVAYRSFVLTMIQKSEAELEQL